MRTILAAIAALAIVACATGASYADSTIGKIIRVTGGQAITLDSNRTFSHGPGVNFGPFVAGMTVQVTYEKSTPVIATGIVQVIVTQPGDAQPPGTTFMSITPGGATIYRVDGP